MSAAKPDETVVSRVHLSFNQEDFKSGNNGFKMLFVSSRFYLKVLTNQHT